MSSRYDSWPDWLRDQADAYWKAREEALYASIPKEVSFAGEGRTTVVYHLREGVRTMSDKWQEREAELATLREIVRGVANLPPETALSGPDLNLCRLWVRAKEWARQ